MRVCLLAVLVGSSGCDPLDGPGSSESTKTCTPLTEPEEALKGKIEFGLKGDGIELFTYIKQDGIRRRVFVRNGERWQELKVTGAGVGGGKNGDAVQLGLVNTEGKNASLYYETKNGALTWAGYVVTKEDEKSKEELEKIPGFVSLTQDPDFELPPASKLNLGALSRSVRFYASFGEDEHVVVINARGQEEGLYLGKTDAVDGASNIRISRLKDGGTIHFTFEYQGKPGQLKIPHPANEELGQKEDAPSLTLDGKKMSLSKIQRAQVPASALDGLTFHRCTQAHAGKS